MMRLLILALCLTLGGCGHLPPSCGLMGRDHKMVDCSDSLPNYIGK